MTKFIHSFNTKPLFINLYDTNSLQRLTGNIWYFALSSAYIKHNGGQIYLHTDTLGSRLLEDISYDDVYLTCNNIDTHPRFWAASKFFSLDTENLDACHIDGDVFLKKEELLAEIDSMECDVLVQNYEGWSSTIGTLPLFNDIDLSPWNLDIRWKGCWNTGIIKFNNQDLKNEFISGYKDIAAYMSEVRKEELDTHPYYTPDLVVEQQYLYCLTEDRYSVYEMLLDPYNNDEVNRKGYQHVLTPHKFKLLDKVKSTLKHVDFELYNKINSIYPI